MKGSRPFGRKESLNTRVNRFDRRCHFLSLNPLSGNLPEKKGDRERSIPAGGNTDCWYLVQETYEKVPSVDGQGKGR